MGIFHSIKKSRRPSTDIDEKIEYLNKELDKNGLREAMTTTGMYVTTKDEPNSSHNAFKGLSHDGASLGFSGSEYNINAEPLDGFKYSPPHPVSGQRKKAFSWFGIASGFQPVSATSDREILWFFDQTLNSGFGDYFSLELTGGSFPFWGTWIDTAFGTSMLVPYDSEYSPLSDAIQNALNNLNINQFLNPEDFGPENNTIVFKNDLGDPDFLPIDVAKKFIAGALDLAIEGFDWLKEKAKKATEKVKEKGNDLLDSLKDKFDNFKDSFKENVDKAIDDGYEWLNENLDINENGEFDWNDTGQLINDALDNVTGKTGRDVFDRITAPLWDSIPGKPKDWMEDRMQDVNKKILDGLNDLQKKWSGEDLQTSVNWMDKYADESRKTNKNHNGKKRPGEVDMTDFTTKEDLDHLTNEVSKNIKDKLNDVKDNFGNKSPLTEKQKNTLEKMKELGVDPNITTQEEYYKELLKGNLNSNISNAINNKDGLANSMGGMPGTWIDNADIDELIETGNLTIHKGRQSNDAGYKFDQDTINPDAKMEFFTGLADVNMDAVGAGGMTAILGAMAGSKLGLKTHYSGDSSGSDSKDVQNTPPMSWKVTFPINVDINESLSNWRNGILVETTIKKKPLPLGGLSIMGFDGNLYPPMTEAQKKRRNFVVPKNKRHLLKKSKLKESLNESVGLGYFDPEVLNVDINDIRKGIMPEFPKDPPPEMIDGYSAKSRLAPKVLKGDPFIKVTKKDLAALHILKDSEIKELLQQIDLINAYLKNNPADLVYAQQRYPKDDIRLAKLNWKMDQMMQAGKDYLDKTFPENEKLFKKIQKSIKKNIELTDPKSFKDVEIPKFEGVNLIDFKRRKEVVSRHFKKAVKIERLFSNKERRNSIREERGYLNKELKKNNLHEIMTTDGMYFGSQEIPGIPAVMADVPDSTGVLGSDFTPPIGGNGDADDPSNYPDAYDNSYMYNSNDVDGETNRPIVRTMDQSVIDAYNNAFPDDSRFPSGGAGIVFGDRGFGTGVGYAVGGHYIGVLSPGLFGNGSTKIVPPGSPFDRPYFGMFGMYFPATPELAEVIMAMSGAYADLGGYNPQGALPIQLWAPWSRFHDGLWENQGSKKYIDGSNNYWVLRTFYMHKAGNQYEKTPAVPPTSIVIQRNDLGDPNFLPIKIDLGDISPQGFEYLEDKIASSDVNYDVYDRLWKDHGIDAANWYENNPNLPGSSNPHVNPLIPLPLELVKNDSRFSEPVSDTIASLGARPGDQLAFASSDDTLPKSTPKPMTPSEFEKWRDSGFEGLQADDDGTLRIPSDPPDDTQTSEDPKTAWENIKDTGSKIANTLWQGAKIVTFAKAGEILADLTLNPIVDAVFGQSVANSAGDYNTKLATSLATSVITGKPQKIVLSKKAKKDLINSIDLDMLDKHMTVGPTPDPTANNAVNPGKGKQNGLLKGKWGNQGGTHINYDPSNGKFTITSVKMLRDFGDLDQKNSGGKITDFEDIPNPSVDQVKQIFKEKGLEGPLKKFYNTVANLGVGSFRPIAAGFSPDEAAEMMYNGLPDMTKALYNFAVEGTASNAVHLRNQLLKAGVGQSEIEKMGAGFGGYVYNQETYYGSDIPGKHGTKSVGGIVNKKAIKYLGILESRKTSLSEEAMLGHFEPEQLNVNIADLRKGIMPEFPKDPPPEMVNGYNSKSRLAPKKLERSSFIKITKKDLAKNHMLKDSEIKYFMKRINAVNDFIKKHPEELVYAQTRYPKSDPRLAQLNWEMDQRLNASKQYMDKNYSENQKLFTKIQKSIKKNIELTDPKSFKGVKVPKFKGVDLTDYKRRKAVVSRHFKKAIRTKGYFLEKKS